VLILTDAKAFFNSNSANALYQLVVPFYVNQLTGVIEGCGDSSSLTGNCIEADPRRFLFDEFPVTGAAWVLTIAEYCE
jgi:hypothetical protein